MIHAIIKPVKHAILQSIYRKNKTKQYVKKHQDKVVVKDVKNGGAGR